MYLINTVSPPFFYPLFMNAVIKCFKFKSVPLKECPKALKIVANIFNLTPYISFPQLLPNVQYILLKYVENSFDKRTPKKLCQLIIDIGFQD